MKKFADWVGVHIASAGVFLVAVGVGIRLLVAPKVKRAAGIRTPEPRPVPRGEWGPS